MAIGGRIRDLDRLDCRERPGLRGRLLWEPCRLWIDRNVINIIRNTQSLLPLFYAPFQTMVRRSILVGGTTGSAIWNRNVDLSRRQAQLPVARENGPRYLIISSPDVLPSGSTMTLLLCAHCYTNHDGQPLCLSTLLYIRHKLLISGVWDATRI